MNVYAFVSDFFRHGGPFMYIILAAAVLIAAIAVERFRVIGRATRLNNSRFLEDLLRLVAAGKTENARLLCGKVDSPASSVAQALLVAEDRRREMLLDTADAEAALALSPLSRRLSHLAMLANVATLLGLLGTIFGLITAFSAVGAADPSQRSAFLAGGISQALNTTAFGLIVAVPTLLIHSYLAGRLESVVAGIDEVGFRLADALADTDRAEVEEPERPVRRAAPAPPPEPRLDPEAEARLARARDESAAIATR